MPECRNCGATLREEYRFCPMCATPQTDEASRRLNRYIEQRATKRQASGGTASSNGTDDDGTLRGRLQYAAGYVAIVLGLATVTAVAGVFFLVAGLFLLPPIHGRIESALGRRLGPAPTAGVAGVLAAFGLVVFVFL